MSTSTEKKTERAKYLHDRRSYMDNDNIVKIVNTIIGLGWVLLVAGGLVFSMAAPSGRSDFFRRFTETTVSGSWNYFLLRIAFAIVGVVAASGLVALLFHMTRVRRKKDKVRKSLIILLVFSLLVFALMLIFMHPLIF